MDRRRFLSAAGAAIGSLAGCVTPPRSGTASPSAGTTTPTAGSPRRVPMGESIAVGGVRLTVAAPTVRKAVVSTGPAHTRVVANTGQFVVVDVLIDGASPDRRADLDLRSTVAGDVLPESDPLPVAGTETRYAFPFPAQTHDRAAIARTSDGANAYWALPEPALSALASEPAFAVPNFGVIRRNGRLALDMTVTNEGRRDGVFAGRASLEGFSGGAIVEFPVPVDESRSYTGRPGDVLLYLENQGGGTLTMQYPADGGLASATQRVRLSETDAESA